MFGRIQIIIIGGILLLSAMSGVYYTWRKGVQREALLEYNQKQLQQHQKDQEDFRQKIAVISRQQEELISKNVEDKKIFNEKIKSAEDYLDSTEIRNNDKPASNILKETVRKLRDAPK